MCIEWVLIFQIVFRVRKGSGQQLDVLIKLNRANELHYLTFVKVIHNIHSVWDLERVNKMYLNVSALVQKAGPSWRPQPVS